MLEPYDSSKPNSAIPYKHLTKIHEAVVLLSQTWYALNSIVVDYGGLTPQSQRSELAKKCTSIIVDMRNQVGQMQVALEYLEVGMVDEFLSAVKNGVQDFMAASEEIRDAHTALVVQNIDTLEHEEEG